MSSGMFTSNRIELSISSGLIEFWCFGLPAALGRGQVDGGNEISGGMGGVPTQCTTCMHAHTHNTHIYTCIEIAVEASMFSMFSMFNMHVTCMCACACVCTACMGHPQLNPPPPNPRNHFSRL